jgi:hypothetical protein
MKSKKARSMRALLFVDAVGLSAKGRCASGAEPTTFALSQNRPRAVFTSENDFEDSADF